MSLFAYVEVVMSIRSPSGDGTSAAEYTSLELGVGVEENLGWYIYLRVITM